MSQSWGPNGNGSFGGQPQGAASWLGDDASGGGTPAGGPNGGGWSPAPTASLLPRRPLDFGEVLGSTFRIVAKNLGVLVGSTFLLVGIANVAGVAVLVPLSLWLFSRVDNATADTRDQVLATAFVGTGLGALVPVVLSVVGTALAQAITVLVVADAARGERSRFRSAWARAWKRVWPLAGYGALFGLAATLALAVMGFAAVLPLVVFGAEVGSVVTTVVLVIVFGLCAFVGVMWLNVKLLFIPSSIVIERRGLWAAVGRSWTLTRSQFWRLFGTVLLMTVMLMIVNGIVSSVPQFFLGFLGPIVMPFGSTGGDSAGASGVVLVASLILSAFTMLVSAVAVALQSTLGAVLYVDTRMRREGLGLHLDRFVEERASGARPTWDPFDEPAVAAPPPALTGYGQGGGYGGYGYPGYGPGAPSAPGYDPRAYDAQGYGAPGAGRPPVTDDPRYARYGSIGAPAPGPGFPGAAGHLGGQAPAAPPPPRTYGEAYDARAARDRAAGQSGQPQQWSPPRADGASAQHTYDPYRESGGGE